MKALIFNSGLGSRLGQLTKNSHKSMLRMGNGETIFGRQLRLLYAAGIRCFVVTTGPFEDQLRDTAQSYHFPDAVIHFVPNPSYAETNYIYSMWLARDYLDDDFLILHGDLVFDQQYAEKMLNVPHKSAGSINSLLELPKKDFKARIADGCITEVSIDIFDEECVAFQPFYKLSQEDIQAWLYEVDAFVQAGHTAVYAENAGNKIFPSLHIHAASYEGHLLEEVDTVDDFYRVSVAVQSIDAQQQIVVVGPCALEPQITGNGVLGRSIRPLLVCGSSFDGLLVASVIMGRFSNLVRFGEFSPNPTIQEVQAGCTAFSEFECDALIAVGGGSAIDVAKAIKAFRTPARAAARAGEPITYTPVPLLAIPTTAGTGSESTSFTVYYENNTKVSLANDMLLPSAAVLDPRVLRSVPCYHKASTFFDALSQAIESYWAIGSTDKSKKYAAQAMDILKKMSDQYFLPNPPDEVLSQVQMAANLSGKAINISKTTGPHAMSYKLTACYGIAHGHAVALCLPRVWRIMLEKSSSYCLDPRGLSYLDITFQEIAKILGFETVVNALNWYEALMDRVGLERFLVYPCDDVAVLVQSVNAERLRNNPVVLDQSTIRSIYNEMFEANFK